jgi:hypothetical protein
MALIDGLVPGVVDALLDEFWVVLKILFCASPAVSATFSKSGASEI